MISCKVFLQERVIFDEPVDMIIVPSESGELGVLPRHPSFLATLSPGLIKTYKGGLISKSIPVSSGIVSVTDQGCVLLTS